MDFNLLEVTKPQFTQYLRQLKSQALSEAAGGEGETKMAANEFTLMKH
jgi:hypothetical protein